VGRRHDGSGVGAEFAALAAPVVAATGTAGRFFVKRKEKQKSVSFASSTLPCLKSLKQIRVHSS